MKKVLKQLGGESTIFRTNADKCKLFFETNFKKLSYDETRELTNSLLGEGEPCKNGYSPNNFTKIVAEKTIVSGNFFEIL